MQWHGIHLGEQLAELEHQRRPIAKVPDLTADHMLELAAPFRLPGAGRRYLVRSI
jgi:hypothetical protein